MSSSFHAQMMAYQLRAGAIQPLVEVLQHGTDGEEQDEGEEGSGGDGSPSGTVGTLEAQVAAKESENQSLSEEVRGSLAKYPCFTASFLRLHSTCYRTSVSLLHRLSGLSVHEQGEHMHLCLPFLFLLPCSVAATQARGCHASQGGRGGSRSSWC